MPQTDMKIKEWLKNMVPKTAGDWIKLIIIVAVIGFMIGLTIYLIPVIATLGTEEGRAAFTKFIHENGAWGVVILEIIQITQVILAVIPGEPVEVLAGILFGTVWGYIWCTVGMLIGTVLIFYAVRFFGKRAIDALADSKQLEKFKFLHNSRRLEMLVFLLFFIPGTPKDILTYFMPLTKIKPLRFFVIVTVARIPSIISSTFAGSSISEGNWVQSIIIFAVIGTLGLLGIWLNDILMKRLEAKKEAKQSEEKGE